MRKPILSLLTLLLLAASIPGAASAQAPPALVVTDTVTQREFHDQVTLVGRSEPRVFSRIVAEVAGRVTRIDAPEGNAITNGSALVSIASERIEYTLRAKKAEVVQGTTQEIMAQDYLRRSEELFKKNLIRQITLDSANAWAASAEARRQQLEAERDQLALDLRNCVVRAPYDGYTLRRLVDIGGWVSPGTPVYEMVDISTITVAVDLPERYYGRLAIGSDAAIGVSNDTLNTYPGTVTGIARNASAATHTFPVIIKVPNPDGVIAGGKLVHATLSFDETFSSLAVSKDAIIRNGLQTMVYTIVDGKAAPVNVLATSNDGVMVAVQGEGLSEGMPVVVRGNERIFPGSPVRVAGEETPGSANVPSDTSAKSN
jgi:RND family efflux transporter MFP subunit